MSLGSILVKDVFDVFFEPPCTFTSIAIARLHSRHAGSPTDNLPRFGASIDEAHTRQSQKEAVGQLASGIAHDFRQLCVIMGVIRITMSLLPPMQTTGLGRAMDVATHGVAVIQSMMHFVRKTAPNPRIVHFPVDVINTTLSHQAVLRIVLVQIACGRPHSGESSIKLN